MPVTVGGGTDSSAPRKTDKSPGAPTRPPRHARPRTSTPRTPGAPTAGPDRTQRPARSRPALPIGVVTCRGSPRTGRDRAGNPGTLVLNVVAERPGTYEPTDLSNICDTSTSVPHGANLYATKAWSLVSASPAERKSK